MKTKFFLPALMKDYQIRWNTNSVPLFGMEYGPHIFVRTVYIIANYLSACLVIPLLIAGGLPTINCFAQGEANVWYFGQNAGLDFNGGVPVAVTNGRINASEGEGCASISDAAGNLLFYTDGMQAWNKNHVQMPDGFGLTGHWSSTQSAIIIQKPGSATIYYIFTADKQTGSNGIRYTEVDRSLNAGTGNVTANKNILLNTPSCEKITVIRHCNNTDIWVVTHDWNSNTFRTYLVTAAGVNTIPVLSNAGIVASGTTQAAIGYLKGSPDGKKLASAISWGIDRFELFDFDNTTGIVSNAILFPQTTGGAYSVEFSPDGTKMYGANITGSIYQFNLCAGTNTAIANSGVLIGTSLSTAVGALQLGPDKKIYLSRFQTPWVGVINSPNTLGAGCNYVDNGVSLAGKIGTFGLPNFVPYYFKKAPPPFTVADTCLTGIFTAPAVNITHCSGSANAITSASWDFGDTASGINNTSAITNPVHVFTNAGTYTVTLVLNYVCGNDTIQQNVTVINCSITATTTLTNILCNGQCTGAAAVTAEAGFPPYTYLWNPTAAATANITGLCAGNYTVTVTDVSGNTVTNTVAITQPAALTTTISSTHFPNVTATVSPSGGTGTYTYLWNTTPPQTTQTAIGLSSGIYCCAITDANNCTDTACVTVVTIESPCDTAEAFFFPNAFSPNNDGENDVLQVYYGNMNCIREMNIVIYNRWGEKVFSANYPSAPWDGSFRGKMEGADVFVYYLRATLTSGEKIIKKGTVSLIK